MSYKKISKSKAYRLIHPKLVVLVTTIDKDNNPNIAPIAWNSPLTHDKPYIGISIAKSHKTHSNILETKEFVINLPSMDILDNMAICASKEPNKIEKAHLEKIDSKEVFPPKIKECYGHIECRLKDKISIDDHTFFVGECVYADVKEGIFDDFKLAIDKIKPIYHLGGRDFATLDKEIYNP